MVARVIDNVVPQRRTPPSIPRLNDPWGSGPADNLNEQRSGPSERDTSQGRDRLRQLLGHAIWKHTPRLTTTSDPKSTTTGFDQGIGSGRQHIALNMRLLPQRQPLQVCPVQGCCMRVNFSLPRFERGHARWRLALPPLHRGLPMQPSLLSSEVKIGVVENCFEPALPLCIRKVMAFNPFLQSPPDSYIAFSPHFARFIKEAGTLGLQHRLDARWNAGRDGAGRSYPQRKIQPIYIQGRCFLNSVPRHNESLLPRLLFRVMAKRGDDFLKISLGHANPFLGEMPGVPSPELSYSTNCSGRWSVHGCRVFAKGNVANEIIWIISI